MISRIFARIVSYLNIFRSSSTLSLRSPVKLTRPPIQLVLNEEFVSKFDEIVVIGDIHGCFDEFVLLLEKIHYSEVNSVQLDPKRILKICTGDLINKGPKNKEVIDYFMNNHDCCLSVRGNHDEVMISEYVKYIQTGELLEKNKWLSELNEKHLNYLMQLPYTIVIPKFDVIVVHAGLVPNIPVTEQDTKNMVEMRNLIEKTTDNGTTVLGATKKDQEGVAWASLWQGPQHVYFGHDAKRKLQEYPFATGLDTGAVYGNQLTGIFVKGPRKGVYVTVRSINTWKDPFQDKH